MKSIFGGRPRNPEADANKVDSTPNSTVPLIGLSQVISEFRMFKGASVCFALIQDAKEPSDKSHAMAARRRRNVLYYDTTTGESWFLLPDNSHIIEKFYLVGSGVDERETFEYDELGDPPIALVVVLRDQGPETRNERAAFSIAICRSDGRSLTRIEGLYRRILGCAAGPDPKEVIVFAQDREFLRALRIDLSDFTIRASQNLVRS